MTTMYYKKMILCVFETIWILLHINFVETIPGHMDPHKRLNCCIIHARPVVGDLALFSQMNVFIIYIETIDGINFENLNFETHLKKCAFSGPQNTVVM